MSMKQSLRMAQVSGALTRELTALKEAQNLLKTTQTVDGQMRFMGKVLDSMMGALIGAGTGGRGMVKAAENMLNMQPFVDAANEMIKCSAIRRDALTRILEMDRVVAQASRPAQLPGKEPPSRRASPYAF